MPCYLFGRWCSIRWCVLFISITIRFRPQIVFLKWWGIKTNGIRFLKQMFFFSTKSLDQERKKCISIITKLLHAKHRYNYAFKFASHCLFSFSNRSSFFFCCCSLKVIYPGISLATWKLNSKSTWSVHYCRLQLGFTSELRG